MNNGVRHRHGHRPPRGHPIRWCVAASAVEKPYVGYDCRGGFRLADANRGHCGCSRVLDPIRDRGSRSYRGYLAVIRARDRQQVDSGDHLTGKSRRVDAQRPAAVTPAAGRSCSSIGRSQGYAARRRTKGREREDWCAAGLTVNGNRECPTCGN